VVWSGEVPPDPLPIFVLENDLNEGSDRRPRSISPDDLDRSMLFRPKQFVKENGELLKSDYELTHTEILKLVKQVITERNRLRTRAMLHQQREGKELQDGERHVSKLAKRIQRGHYTRTIKDIIGPKLRELIMPTASLCQRTKHSGQISLAKRIDIVH